ncbi:MAG: type II toxin-antitoxin system HigA family antitoxin [Bacteroidota bacterium]
MSPQLIKTKRQYLSYLSWVAVQLDKGVKPTTPLGEKIQLVLLLIKHYEDIHYQVPKPDPIKVIKEKMREQGLRNKDLVGEVGSKGYVSAILNKKKPLTLDLAKLFHEKLQIPASVLLS